MSMQKDIVEDLLGTAGVSINGSNPWDIQVRDGRFYGKVLGEGSLGLGESYMDGWWDCEQPDEFISRLLKARLDQRVKGGLKYLLPVFAARLVNRQSGRRARVVAEHHYDLGNDLFMAFLDPHNQYSCAYFSGTDDLHQAQLAKMELICRKLGLREGNRVLDVGSGWGGLARFLSENCGCQVTAVNISKEQLNYARETCRDLPVSFLDCDYRDIQGKFEKVISVGMFEHVGYRNYRTYMNTIHHCMEDEGIFLLHTIGSNESGVNGDPWTDRYIFPNGMLPSLAQLGRAVEGLFVIEDVHNLGPHYDRTLMAWNENFQREWPRLKELYDDTFKRMWEYFLLSMAGAFRARRNQVWQIVFTKYGKPQPAGCDRSPTGGIGQICS